MRILLALSLLPVALIPVLPLIWAARVERRLQSGESEPNASRIFAILLAASTASMIASGLVLVYLSSTWPSLETAVLPAALVSASLCLFLIYRALYLFHLLSVWSQEERPAPSAIRRMTLRYLGITGAGVTVVLVISQILKLFPALAADPYTRHWIGLLIMALGLSLFLPSILSLLLPWHSLAPGFLLNGARRLAREAGLSTPRIRVLERGKLRLLPNAWITGLTARDRTIFLTEPLVDTLPEDEALAIVAHELGHARLHHVPIYALITFASIAMAWALGSQVGFGPAFLKPLTQVVILLVIAPIALGPVMQRCEFAADRFGAKLIGDPGLLIRALQSLHAAADEHLPRPAKAKRSKWSRYARTHPDLDERIRAMLEKSDQES